MTKVQAAQTGSEQMGSGGLCRVADASATRRDPDPDVLHLDVADGIHWGQSISTGSRCRGLSGATALLFDAFS